MERKNNWAKMLKAEFCWRKIRRLRQKIKRELLRGQPLTSIRLQQLDRQICALGLRAYHLEWQ